MNKSMASGIIVLASLAATASVVAGFGMVNGKKIATVAGAPAGGYAGYKTQEKIQAGDTYITTENRCETVVDTRHIMDGYQVTYRLDGEQYTVRMDQHPGDSIPGEGGELVLSKS